MFDTAWIGDLDADAACAAITDTQHQLRHHEWNELLLAAHWAVLHDGATLDARAGTGSTGTAGSAGGVLPGTERSIRVGGPGTPQITEFASAELGLLMGTGFIAATSLLRDASTSTTATPCCGPPSPKGRAGSGRPARSPG